MPIYAQIDHNNVVVSVSELAESVERSDLVPIPLLDLSLLGCVYDGQGFTPPAAPIEVRIITKVSMLTRRLKTMEFVGILTAAKTDPAIEAWKYVFDAASQVDLDAQNTKDGMALLVAKGLLTQARADEILSAPVEQGERP